MARLRYSAAARDDPWSIAEYVASESGSRAVAERFTEALRWKCRELADAPIQMGRPRPELLPGLRRRPFRSYMIFFRYVGDVLEVVNVIEGHRDIGAFFTEREP